MGEKIVNDPEVVSCPDLSCPRNFSPVCKIRVKCRVPTSHVQCVSSVPLSFTQTPYTLKW